MDTNEPPLQAGPDTVCIVDDDDLVRETLVKLLKVHQIKVHSHANGQQLLADPWCESYSCLVMDVLMPRVGGLEVQKRLAARGIDIPIIFISGHGDVPMAVKAMSDGAFYFLQKPVDAQMLLEKVQLALEHSRSRRIAEWHRSTIEKRMQTLTRREQEVFRHLIKGESSKKIAAELGIGIRTMEDYRSNILKKMKANTLPELIAKMSGYPLA